MTRLYFVRHAQPDFYWQEDRTRPLTAEGRADSGKVTEYLRNVQTDCFISSPYVRSCDTIKAAAAEKNLPILTDERLRERKNGKGSNVYGMYQRRWGDFSFHEEDGESIGMVQERNVEAVLEILANHASEAVVIGTHGTALSAIQNYFEPAYGCEDFLRMVDFMPYILRMDFEGARYLGKEELLIVKKAFNGPQRPDIKPNQAGAGIR